MAIDFISVIDKVGFAGVFVVYLIYESRKNDKYREQHTDAMTAISAAMNNQTNTLNHTLTKQISMAKAGFDKTFEIQKRMLASTEKCKLVNKLSRWENDGTLKIKRR